MHAADGVLVEVIAPVHGGVVAPDQHVADAPVVLVDVALADGVLPQLVEERLGFIELQKILERFPNEADWSNGDMRKMYAEVLAAASTKDTDAEPRAVTRVKVADYKAVVERCTEAESLLKRREADLEEVKTNGREENEKLRGEIHDLRIENAQLKGRISELEKFAQR